MFCLQQIVSCHRDSICQGISESGRSWLSTSFLAGRSTRGRGNVPTPSPVDVQLSNCLVSHDRPGCGGACRTTVRHGSHGDRQGSISHRVRRDAQGRACSGLYGRRQALDGNEAPASDRRRVWQLSPTGSEAQFRDGRGNTTTSIHRRVGGLTCCQIRSRQTDDLSDIERSDLPGSTISSMEDFQPGVAENRYPLLDVATRVSLAGWLAGGRGQLLGTPAVQPVTSLKVV